MIDIWPCTANTMWCHYRNSAGYEWNSTLKLSILGDFFKQTTFIQRLCGWNVCLGKSYYFSKEIIKFLERHHSVAPCQSWCSGINSRTSNIHERNIERDIWNHWEISWSCWFKLYTLELFISKHFKKKNQVQIQIHHNVKKTESVMCLCVLCFKPQSSFRDRCSGGLIFTHWEASEAEQKM